MLAAQRRAFEALGQTIAWACAAEQDWPHGATRGVAACLAFAACFPNEARLAFASNQVASEPAFARQALPAHERRLEMLREGAQRHPGPHSPNRPCDVDRRELPRGRRDRRLPEVQADFLELVLGRPL